MALKLETSHKGLPIGFKYAAVVAMGIWPDDRKAREEFLALLCLRPVAGMIPPDKIKDVLLAASEATPFSVLEGRFRNCFYPALQAGGYLHEAVALSSLGIKFSMKRLVGLMVSEFGGQPGAANTPKQFENQVWRTYRPVAHLWAAYLHRRTDEIDNIPPFSAKALPEFLSLAEGFRVLGEQTKTRGRGAGGASRTLLSPGQRVVLPISLRVPPPTKPKFLKLDYVNYNYSLALGNS